MSYKKDPGYRDAKKKYMQAMNSLKLHWGFASKHTGKEKLNVLNPVITGSINTMLSCRKVPKSTIRNSTV